MPIAGTSTMTLRQKLAAIRREIHNIEKRGFNEFHRYNYAQASDVAGQIGTSLAEHNIIVARRNLEVTRGLTGRDNKEMLVELKLDYGFLDADSNEELWQPAYGEGRDTGDKAAYKAFTGAFKYLLIQAFCLATGDDPEADSEDYRNGKKFGEARSGNVTRAGQPEVVSSDDALIQVPASPRTVSGEADGKRREAAFQQGRESVVAEMVLNAITRGGSADGSEADGKPGAVQAQEGEPAGASADDPTLTEAQAKIIADLIKAAHPHNAMNVIRQRWNRDFQSMRQLRRSQVRAFCKTVGIEEPQ